MTLGSRGVLISSKDGGEPQLVPCPSIPKEKVKDTSGAGDSFIGALSYFLTTRSADKADLKANLHRYLAECAVEACKVASLSVQGRGTQTSYPDLEQVTIAYE